MASDDECISAAVMADDAAQRAKRLVLALHGHGDALHARVLADAVADGTRRGALEAMSGQLMSRADAHKYAVAGAAAAVASTLAAIANRLPGTDGPPNEISIVAGLTGLRVGASATSQSPVKCFAFSHFALAFFIGVVAAVAFGVIFRYV